MRNSAAGGEVEPPKQFLPARFGGIVERFDGGIVEAAVLQSGDSVFDALPVRAKPFRQRRQEGEPIRGVRVRIAREQRLREGDAGRLAPPR